MMLIKLVEIAFHITAAAMTGYCTCLQARPPILRGETHALDASHRPPTGARAIAPLGRERTRETRAKTVETIDFVPFCASRQDLLAAMALEMLAKAFAQARTLRRRGSTRVGHPRALFDSLRGPNRPDFHAQPCHDTASLGCCVMAATPQALVESRGAAPQAGAGQRDPSGGRARLGFGLPVGGDDSRHPKVTRRQPTRPRAARVRARRSARAKSGRWAASMFARGHPHSTTFARRAHAERTAPRARAGSPTRSRASTARCATFTRTGSTAARSSRCGRRRSAPTARCA